MPNIVRTRRRQTGLAGPPASLYASELAFNEVDNTLYYGKGTNGATPPVATSVIPVVTAGGGAQSGVLIADAPPAGASDNALWWSSSSGVLSVKYNDGNSTAWVQVSQPGIGDAPADGQAYSRKNNQWTAGGDFLPLTGGVVTGAVTINHNANYALIASQSLTTGGAVYGENNGMYGILAYNGYSVYGNGPWFTSGNITAGGAVLSQYGFQNTAIANCIMFWGGNAIWTIPSNIYHEFAFAGTTYYRMETTTFRPLHDNARLLGTSNLRWATVYAGTGTINTSDEKEKQDIRPLNEAELRVARALKPFITAYRWKASVAEKADDARIHFGIIAQRVDEAFAAEGLNARTYGMFCADPIKVLHPAERNEDGSLITEEWEEDTGEERLGVRYDELIIFILAGM